MCRLLLLMIGILFAIHAHAFPCFLTLVKNNCWTQYNVSVDVVDVTTEKVITTFVIPQGESYKRQTLVCQPKETLMFKATFTPAFWEKDAGKIYSGKRYWSFPETIVPHAGAWNMTVCFTDDFAETPLPPEATGNCVCDKKSLPVIKPL